MRPRRTPLCGLFLAPSLNPTTNCIGVPSDWHCTLRHVSLSVAQYYTTLSLIRLKKDYYLNF